MNVIDIYPNGVLYQENGGQLFFSQNEGASQYPKPHMVKPGPNRQQRRALEAKLRSARKRSPTVKVKF